LLKLAGHPAETMLMQRSPGERRKYPRIATDQVISFMPLDAGAQQGVGKNVSASGIRFEAVGVELALGDVIRVTFSVGDETLVAVAQVVWSTEIDPITTDVGLEFVEIDAGALRTLQQGVTV
jgi:hypothetical protein